MHRTANDTKQVNEALAVIHHANRLLQQMECGTFETRQQIITSLEDCFDKIERLYAD